MLDRFISSFTRAVAGEMEALRRRMGPYEIPLADGERLDDGDDAGARLRFRVLQPDDKIVQGGECSLVTEAGDHLVTVASIDGDRITLTCEHAIDLDGGRVLLVIYPWFLYERLQAALRELRDREEAYHTDTALALFSRDAPRRLAAPGADAGTPASAPPGRLNDSQRRAVDLCREVTPAFVWGPPGTGKTTTLGHIILSLLGLGQRLLVTSTTNAAVDQALACLARLPEGRAAIDRGEVVRLGQTQADTCGASLREVVDRASAEAMARIDALEARRAGLQARCERGRRLRAELEAEAPSTQLGLFAASTETGPSADRFRGFFGDVLAVRLAARPAAAQQAAVARRLRRLEHAARLCVEGRQVLQRGLRARESVVVDEARLVLATMTNVYISSLMEGQRFDAVIVEEAGMAVLPTLFYCASLGRQRAIMVGDPQQLPPIVQSDEPFVQRAMGRSIFEVALGEGLAEPGGVGDGAGGGRVVMLDTQYRMHPRIGDLVGGLFYGGRLRHGATAESTAGIVAGAPYPGEALVVVDTSGRATCATPPGSYSRFNEVHAELAVELAAQAVRDGAASVAIITPSVEQARRIGRHLARRGDVAERIDCRTVHRFQGGERDVVLFDTVDAEPLPPGRLLSAKAPGSSAANLVNVSLSRARGKLVILADGAYFRRRDPAGIVARVLAAAAQGSAVVRA